MKIRIKDIEYPIRVTLGAQLLFKQETGRELAEMDGTEDFARYVYACARSASKADGMELKVSFEEFVDHFDQSLIDEWTEMQLEAIQKKTTLRQAQGTKA